MFFNFKFQRLVSLVLIISMISSSSVFGNSNENILDGVFEFKPSNISSRNIQSDNKKAWITDLDGNVTEVDPINFNLRLPSGYGYFFESYNQKSTRTDNTKFYVGEVSVYNGTSSTGTLQYKQSNTKSVSWQVSSEVSAKAEFGNALLGSIEGSTSVSVGRNATSSQSNSVEYATSVPAYKNRTIKKYHKGYGSGGIVVYKRYQSGSFAGYYSEESSNWGWVPALNQHSFTVHNY